MSEEHSPPWGRGEPIRSAPKDGSQIVGWYPESMTYRVILWSETNHTWRCASTGLIVDHESPTKYLELPSPDEL